MMGYVAWLGSISCRLLFRVHCVHYIGYSHPHLTFRHSRLSTLYRVCGGGWTQRCTHTHTHATRQTFPHLPLFHNTCHPRGQLPEQLCGVSEGVSLHPPLLSGIHPHGQNRGLLIIWTHQQRKDCDDVFWPDCVIIVWGGSSSRRGHIGLQIYHEEAHVGYERVVWGTLVHIEMAMSLSGHNNVRQNNCSQTFLLFRLSWLSWNDKMLKLINTACTLTRPDWSVRKMTWVTPLAPYVST